MKISKDLIGKLVKVTWCDPQTECRTTLRKFLKEPYGTIYSTGIIRHVTSKLVVLSSEQIKDDEDEDLTAIHPALITNVETLGG